MRQMWECNNKLYFGNVSNSKAILTGSILCPQVLASRSATETASPPYLGTSCVLTSYIFTLSPPFPCPLQMPLEPRNSPRRTYQRMYRRIQHPYRLLSLSERMHIYRPILPSLQEEESTEQRANIEIQERPSRTSKRQTRIYSSYQQRAQIPENYGESTQLSESQGLRRIPPNHWIRRTRQTQWQEPDEPEIIITSDVQLQTDDAETGFNSNGLLSEQSPTSPTELRELPTDYETSSAPTDDATPMSSVDNNIPEITSGYLDIQSIESESYPDNRSIDSRNTQLPYQTTRMETAQTDVSEKCTSPKSEELVCSNPSDFNKSLRDLSSVVSFKLYARSVSIPALPAPTFKARQVANKMIKHARNNKTLNEKGLHCLNCDLFPILPVTGHCGHTRCTKYVW